MIIIIKIKVKNFNQLKYLYNYIKGIINVLKNILFFFIIIKLINKY